MKFALFFSFLFFILTLSTFARTWKQAGTGKEITADLVRVEGSTVVLRLADGREGRVEVLSLSLEDQEFIAKQSTSGGGEDWPQFRGANRDGVSPDKDLLKEWPADGPEKLWVYEGAGLGYSGIIVAAGKGYTMGTQGDAVTVVCFDVATGEEVWKSDFAKDDQSGYNTGWGHGPRGAPTVADGKVYALGPKGVLGCLNAEDGKKIWTKDLVSDFGGKAGGWGFSESPFVEGDKVVVGPGGKTSPVVALNKDTGAEIWTASGFDVGGGKAEYATTVPVDLNGKRQYLRLFSNQLVSLDSETGELLWTTTWPGEGSPAVIPTPIADGNQIFISSGYGVGSKLVEVNSSNEASDVWMNKTMKNKHGGMIKFGDHIYGSSEGGGLICQDWKSGELVWNEKGQFFGSTDSIAIADGMIYCLNDQSGTISLVEASPDGFKQSGQFALEPQSSQRNPKGKVWTYPLVIGGKLFLRDQEIVVCYDISTK